jgi:hypothetical protein
MEEQEKEQREGELRGFLKGNSPREGSGDGLTPRESFGLAEKAAKNRWPISDEMRADVIRVAQETLSDPNTRPRDRNAAMRVLASFDALNVARERIDSGIDEGPSVSVRFDKSGGGGIQKVIGAFLREGYTE